MKRDKFPPVYDAEYFEPPRGKMKPCDKLIWYTGALITIAFVVGVVIGLARLL